MRNVKEKIIAGIDKTAFFFFIILVFFLPISIAAIEIMFVSIFLCVIFKGIFKGVHFDEIKLFFKNRINLAVLVFYLYMIPSLLISGQLIDKSFNAWFFKWGEGVLLFYFAQVFLDNKKVKQLMYVFLMSAVLISIDGLYQKINGVDFIRRFELGRQAAFTAITATFHHYNDFAAYLGVLFFIVCGVLYSSNRRLEVRIGLVFLLIAIIANLLFTYSRGAWVSFLLVNLFLTYVSYGKKYKIFFISFLIIFVLGVMSVSSLRERFLFIFAKEGDAHRVVVWKVAINMFKESPFVGKGVGLFMNYFAEHGRLQVQYTHNCYLQILAETGLAGFIPFLWFIMEVIRGGIKKLKQKSDKIYLGLFCGLLTFLIHAFFDTQLYSLKLSILFWLLISFLVIYVTTEKDISPKNSKDKTTPILKAGPNKLLDYDINFCHFLW